jgi:hypothetical protein
MTRDPWSDFCPCGARLPLGPWESALCPRCRAKSAVRPATDSEPAPSEDGRALLDATLGLLGACLGAVLVYWALG